MRGAYLMDIFNVSQCYEKALDAATLRQQVISNNIANVNTQGFTPSKVNFEDEMKRCMAAANDNDGFQVLCHSVFSSAIQRL